jgi:hypothetical protein
MIAGQATSPTQNLNPPTIKRKPERPARPQPEELQQPTQPLPPSNSTSPQLANVLSHPVASHPVLGTQVDVASPDAVARHERVAHRALLVDFAGLALHKLESRSAVGEQRRRQQRGDVFLKVGQPLVHIAYSKN